MPTLQKQPTGTIAEKRIRVVTTDGSQLYSSDILLDDVVSNPGGGIGAHTHPLIEIDENANIVNLGDSVALVGDIAGSNTFDIAGDIEIDTVINLPAVICIDGGDSSSTFPGQITGPYGAGTQLSEIEILDEGISLSTDVTKINFLGAGVTAAVVSGNELSVTVAGAGSGLFTEDVNLNIFGGTGSGAVLSTIGTATDNLLIGSNTGNLLTSGDNNTFIGIDAGKFASSTSHDSVFIGHGAGPASDTQINYQLFINDAPTLTPLIHGSFFTPKVTINGELATTGHAVIVGHFDVYDSIGEINIHDSNSSGAGNTAAVLRFWNGDASIVGHLEYLNGVFELENDAGMMRIKAGTSAGNKDIEFYAGTTKVAEFDDSSTATETRFLIYDVDNATLERVTVGAADSGGTNFKVLRIPN
jgi:hypothetical protein